MWGERVTFSEIKKDLFNIGDDYILAHCISADARMGAGIAVEFKARFKLKTLQASARTNSLKVGTCYKEGRTLNLITKEKYWHKPTYDTMASAIAAMREVCVTEGITQLAMPQIGCGLDKLQWGKVREIIMDAFADTDIEIVVCKL